METNTFSLPSSPAEAWNIYVGSQSVAEFVGCPGTLRDYCGLGTEAMCQYFEALSGDQREAVYNLLRHHLLAVLLPEIREISPDLTVEEVSVGDGISVSYAGDLVLKCGGIIEDLTPEGRLAQECLDDLLGEGQLAEGPCEMVYRF